MLRFTAFFLLSAVTVVSAQSTEADARKLMQKVGADRIFDTMIVEMGKRIAAQARPIVEAAALQNKIDLPPVFWTDLRKFTEEDLEAYREDFQKRVAGLYVKHFTPEDFRQLIAFYDSPVGAKLIQVLPQLMVESMQVGEQWGKDIGPPLMKNVILRLQMKGYFEPKAKAPAPKN